MWPLRRRIEPVLAAQAGDDATAALATILRHHERHVPLDAVRRAIYVDGGDIPNALQIVNAAATFGLLARGLMIENPAILPSLPMPNIAHLIRSLATLPPDLAAKLRVRFRLPPEVGVAGQFAVVEEATPRRIVWVDPDAGRTKTGLREFRSFSSGVFLVFEKARPLPS